MEMNETSLVMVQNKQKSGSMQTNLSQTGFGIQKSNLSQTWFGIQNTILKSEILWNPINISVWIEQFNLYFLFMKSLVKVLVWAKFSLHILERNMCSMKLMKTPNA